MSAMKGMKTEVILLVLWFSAMSITAQVIFDPDPEEDVQLQLTPLTPPVNVTTVECYSSSPQFKVQYVAADDYVEIYDIRIAFQVVSKGYPISGSTCEQNQTQYRIRLQNLEFVADPVLVGGTFKLKATLDNNGNNSAISKRTYAFPAPFNLTGSSVSALVNTTFTWTCHVTSKNTIIEWYRGDSYLGQVGISNGACITFGIKSYIYDCQSTALTYTLTIPAYNMTEELQASTWRCRDVTTEVNGSRFMKLDIVVPVITVTISPGSGSSFVADEYRTVTFTCTTNNANPPPTVLLFIGSSQVISQTGSNRTTFTLNITRAAHQMSVRCVAWNSGNTANLSDSTTLNVRSSATFQTKEYCQLAQPNKTASIGISFHCNPPVTMSGVSWINKTDLEDRPIESSEIISLSLVDDDITLVIGNTNVTFRGQKALMNITSVETYHRGYYVLKIQNSTSLLGSQGIVLDVTLRPDPPRSLTVQYRDGFARLSWSFSNNLGLDVSFVVLYKEENEGKYTVVEKHDTNVGQSYIEHVEVMSIKPKVIYYFKVASKNINGLSEYTESKACVIFDEAFEVSSTGASVGGVAGGITGAFIVLIAVLITVMVVRERRYRIGKGARSKENKSTCENYEDIQSPNGSNGQGTETGHRQDERSTYEELQTSRDVHTYDHVDNRTQYQNL